MIPAFSSGRYKAVKCRVGRLRQKPPNFACVGFGRSRRVGLFARRRKTRHRRPVAALCEKQKSRRLHRAIDGRFVGINGNRDD